jgi:hypothetical protein
MRKLAVLMVIGVLVGGARDVAAQDVDDRVFINIGFGVESGSSESNDTKQYTLYGEPATTNANTSWTSGSIFGFGADFRVIRNFTVGLSYHQETNASEAALSGTAPHPIFFNRPRSFEDVEGGLYRRENATHLSFGWIVPINPKLDVLVSGGPSWFRLEQDVISDVIVEERAGDFSSVIIDPRITMQKRSDVGYNVGADATYILWQNDRVRVGAGGFIRYTGATSEVRLLVSDIETKVGGMQFGFGGRLRF